MCHTHEPETGKTSGAAHTAIRALVSGAALKLAVPRLWWMVRLVVATRFGANTGGLCGAGLPVCPYQLDMDWRHVYMEHGL